MGVDDPTVADGAAASMSSTDIADLADRVLRDRYQITRRVGAGSMGDVYEGIDRQHGGRIAIKVLKPERAVREVFRHRFLREAKSAVLIDHPNVVDVLDYGETDDGLLFIAMEFLEGDDLSSHLKEGGRMAWPHSVMVLQQVAAALAAAHDRGVVHRDVKPSNILLRGTGAGTGPIVKLVDFGVAKLDNHMVSRVLTQAADVVGTVLYMSPEQAEGRAADLRSDVYAFGVTAFQMVTGQVPFPGRDLFKVMSAHLSEPPPDPVSLVPGLPDWANAFILRCLEKKPEDRYQSMHDVLSILAGKNEPDMVSRPRPNTPISQAKGTPHPPLADESVPPLDPAAPTVAGDSFNVETGMLAPAPVDDFDDEAPTAYYQAPKTEIAKNTPLVTPVVRPAVRQTGRTQAVPIISDSHAPRMTAAPPSESAPFPAPASSHSAPFPAPASAPIRSESAPFPAPAPAPSESAPFPAPAPAPAPSESAPFPLPVASSEHSGQMYVEVTERARYGISSDEIEMPSPKSSAWLYVLLVVAVVAVAIALVFVLAPL